jgi:GTPase SAR1 family protein
VVLVANKVDLRSTKGGVPADEIKRYLAKRSKWRFLECSARQNYNVKEVFRVVGGMLRENGRERERMAQSSRMKIDPSKLRKNSDSSCC